MPVLGWKGVRLMVEVGVFVIVGLSVMVPVMMGGVPLAVTVAGVPDVVRVIVTLGVMVMSSGFGAKERQTTPAQ